MIPNSKDPFPQIANAVYLDNATCNPIPYCTLEAMKKAMEKHLTVMDLSIHSIARKSAEVFDEAMEIIAQWLGTKGQDLQWVPNRDFATSLSVQAFPPPRSVFLPLFDDLAIHGTVFKRKGTVLVDERHSIWEEELLERAEKGDVLIMNHVSPLLGRVRKTKKIVEIARDLEMVSIIDFSFSAGQYDITKLINLPSVSIVDGTRDLFGPAGATIVIDNQQVESQFHGTRNIISYSDLDTYQINQKSFELGIPNLVSLIGLMHSVKFLRTIGRPIMEDKKKLMATKIQEIIADNSFLLRPRITYGEDNFSDEASSIHTFSFEKASAHDFALIGDEIYGLKVRSGLLCSHLGMKKLGWNDGVQVSTHYYNDQRDLETLSQALNEFETFL